MMFPNFIRRNKRKGKKANESRSHSHQQLSTVSSPVFDIHEEFSLASTIQSKGSLMVELNFSDSKEEWFPQELLQSRSGSPRTSVHRAQTGIAAQNNSMRDAHIDPPAAPYRSQSERVSFAALSSFRKKSIPAPIMIPGSIPDIEIRHLDKSTEPSLETSQRITKDTSMNPSSPSASDDLSAISGTTLARLISSSFVLSLNERRGSRPRTVVRQDSATLPHGEPASLGDSEKPPPVPPVPPVPAVLVSAPSNPNCPSATESTRSDLHIASSEVMTDPAIPRRMSRIQEVPSPTLSMSTRTMPILVPIVPDTTPQRKVGSTSPRPRVFKNVLDVPQAETAVEVPLIPGSQDPTQHLSREETFLGSDDHSLDEFDFVPPGCLRGDTSRGRRKRMLGRVNLTRRHFKKNSSAEHFVRQLGDGKPSAAMLDHDYGELLKYDLTLNCPCGSAHSSRSSHTPSSGSAGYQTFPETPVVFSPLWSPAHALIPKSDSQLRRHSQNPKSAGPLSAKLYSSTRPAKCQLDKKNGVTALRRSRSSLLPIQKTLSPKQGNLVLLPSAEAKEEAGITDETNVSSTAKVESKNVVVELQSRARPHPLAHISTCSSYLLEEEALQALAKDSASLLSSDSVHSLVTDTSIRSPTSVPLPPSPDATPSDSLALTDAIMASSSSASPLSPTTIVVSQTRFSKSPLSCPHSWGSSFLPSPSPPVSLDELPSVPPSPIPVTASSCASDALLCPSFFPPPPYHTVVSERTPYYPGSTSSPSLSQASPADPAFQRSRQTSSASSQSYSNMRTRATRRPPLPMGPREPSGPGSVLCSFARSRNGSESSVKSGDTVGSLWRKLQSVVSEPPPKFHVPPPKWRGLTLEAAQWTFTSEQLQGMVSQAIQQSSEGSSLRLLRLEVLDGEIADEVHRLELQHTDIKAQYKTLVRKRWALIGTLASHIEGETNERTAASRTMQELADVLLALDRLAGKMHDIVLQLSQLKSLRDVHNASALALAVRKINGVFVRQMAEKERLQDQVNTLQTERDEAWKHAEDIAEDYDTLNERVSESVEAIGGDIFANNNNDDDARSLKSSRRSTRILAVRKSSIYQSQAGLRSRKARSVRSSMSATRPTSLVTDIPPVPPLPLNTSINSETAPVLTGASRNSRETISTISDALALAQAQREVYEMLGLSLPPSRASSRRRTISWGLDFPKPPPFRSRPMSASLETRTRRVRDDCHSAGRRAVKSAVLDDRPPAGFNRFTLLS